MVNQVAYGVFNSRDAADRLITEVGVREVTTAIDLTMAQHNAEITDLMSLFVRPTTEFKIQYRTPARNRLQPIDTIGRALPIKGGGVYGVEWPLKLAGTAWGMDYHANLKMTVRQAAEQNELMLEGDRVWMREQLLAALFANVDWTWPDEVHDLLTIHGLANNDAVTYLRTGGRAAAQANHYLGQANQISDSDNPYPTISAALKSYPDNSGKVIALIPTNLKADTEDLATFQMAPDQNIRPATSDEVLVGSLGVSVPGEVIGYEKGGGVWIVEWPSLPDSRIVAVMSGGERPLAMRQDALAALQGFNRVGTRDDFPFTEFQYQRLAGFGAWNRVGAVVMEIGDASYDVPTGYEQPMV